MKTLRRLKGHDLQPPEMESSQSIQGLKLKERLTFSCRCQKVTWNLAKLMHLVQHKISNKITSA